MDNFALAQNKTAPPDTTYPRAIETVTVSTPHKIRRAIRSPNDHLTVFPTLYARQIQSGLGDISALALGDNGDIYALDKKGGRLFLLSDRRFDGEIDTLKLLSRGFERPSGLTYHGGFIYVADAKAIWRVHERLGTKALLASLSNVDALASPRPLISFDEQIWLGLAQRFEAQSGGSQITKAHILSLDVQTGTAKSVMRLPHKYVSHFTKRRDGQIWAATPSGIQAIAQNTPHYQLEPGATPQSILFIDKTNLPEKWPEKLTSNILAAQSATRLRISPDQKRRSGGFNIASLTTSFGIPAQDLTVFASGFMHKNQRQAWGKPGAMLIDKRGLFIADPWNGTLWLIAYDDRPKPAPEKHIGNERAEVPMQKPSHEPNETPAMTGSHINSASTIQSGSTLRLGSTIIINAEDTEKTETQKNKPDY